jgi:hypothetical protein
LLNKICIGYIVTVTEGVAARGAAAAEEAAMGKAARDAANKEGAAAA